MRDTRSTSVSEDLKGPSNPLLFDSKHLETQLLLNGVDDVVRGKVLQALNSIENPTAERVLDYLESIRHEIASEAAIEIKARATRRGFVEIENPESRVEKEFQARCSTLITSNEPGFVTINLPDEYVVARLNNELHFLPPPNERDNYEVSIIGDLSLISSKVGEMLTKAGIADAELASLAVTSITSRVATVLRALESDSANVIVTCRLRRGSGNAELDPHFDGTFDPRNSGTNAVEYKALSVLAGPTTKVWKEGDFNRELAMAADGSVTEVADPEIAKLSKGERSKKAIKDSKPISLKHGELLVFKSGDLTQATLHTVPAFPPEMDRLLLQINPLPFESVEAVWWKDQEARVKRTLNPPE